MIDIRQVKEQQKDIHPGFGSYLECMTRGLFTGLSGFCLCKFLSLNPLKQKLFLNKFSAFSAVYWAQKIGKNYLPYPKKFNILVCCVTGTIVAFKISKDRSQACGSAWMAAEDKYTALTNIEE